MTTYVRRFVAAIIGYAVVLMFSITVLNHTGAALWRYAVAVLPVIPVGYGLWAFLQMLRTLDELQFRIQMEAFGFSLGWTGLITFTLGFLEIAGFPQVGLIWVLPMIIAFWGIGQQVALRRYR